MHAKRLPFLLAALAFWLAGCAHYSKVQKRSVEHATTTAEQQALVKSLKALESKPLAKLGLLLDDVDATRHRLAANPSDTLAQSDYNFAVSRIMEIIEDDHLTPWDAPVACVSPNGIEWSLSLTPPDPRPEYSPSNFEILPADRYDFKGKLVGERILKLGLGAPVVVVGKDLDFTKYDQFAQGKQVFYGLTATVNFNGQDCNIELRDPLDEETVPFDGRDYTLAADFQSPLALSLAELDPKKREIAGMFKPGKFESAARLARLQRYNPDKIPVVCIHGLGNSPSTWAPAIDFLRNDAEIRKNFQFWFYSYPTGLPIPLSAAILRKQLDQMKERYPDHKDLVVIGHSLGGNITRLLTTDAGMALWDTYFDRPPDEIPFTPESREILRSSLIFEARSDISRVIFASASLRGSEVATRFLGRLGSKIIGNPIPQGSVSDEALRYMRPEMRSNKRNHLPNSIDMLDPENSFLPALNALPIKPGLPYHSIIGDQGKGGNLDHTKPQSTDGIVPYWSSHLEGALSEVIIPSGHWSIHHPMGMAEIKRILLLHARQN
jgi:pimeloyl-ACP methyl ester carboxylesterase